MVVQSVSSLFVGYICYSVLCDALFPRLSQGSEWLLRPVGGDLWDRGHAAGWVNKGGRPFGPGLKKRQRDMEGDKCLL